MSDAPALAPLPRVILAGQVAGAIRDAVPLGAFAPGRRMDEAEIAVRSADPIRCLRRLGAPSPDPL